MMALVNLQSLPDRGVLIGLDPGARRLGLAVCDSLRLIATPLAILKRGRRLAPSLAELFALIDERGAVGLVCGLPLNMDGSEGPRSQAARALVHNILEYRDIPIAFQDERLSSTEAERVMIDADLSRARRAESLDSSSAAIILQTALDRLVNISKRDASQSTS
jgi:putative Holliday junction resolvase